jgi:multidrug efflux pump subunit AcrA (membrane-fusion protein)
MRKHVLGLALAAFIASSCGSSPRTPSPETTSAPIAVSVADVASIDLPTRIEAGGIVQAGATAYVTSRVVAPIQIVHVRAGDRVARGQTLVTLDARELIASADRAGAAVTAAVEASRAAESRTASAEAAQRLAAATHTRIKGLYDKRSATAQEFDQAVAALEAANAQASTARSESSSAAAARDAARAASEAASVARSYAVLTAPFDGVIADRMADPGSLASPDLPLLIVEQAGQRHLDVRLDDSAAARISVGQAVEVRLDERDATSWVESKVVEVGRADSASHSVLVKLDLPDGTARTGSFGRARVVVSSRRTLVVPSSSVVRRAGLTFVFTVDASRHARLRPVVSGGVDANRAEVLTGVSREDVVVVNPPPALTDGSVIEIATRQPAGAKPESRQ